MTSIVHTYKNLNNPQAVAEAFRLELAQLGYTSELRALANGCIVVASDGKAVKFLGCRKASR